jgi:hypothetical protein
MKYPWSDRSIKFVIALQAWDETPVTSLNVSARSPAELETLADLVLDR